MNNCMKKLLALATTAAMLCSSVCLQFSRPLTAYSPVSGAQAKKPLPAKVLSATTADAGMAGLEQLDSALTTESSEQVTAICDTLSTLLERELREQNVQTEAFDDPVLEARRQQYQNEMTVRAARTRNALNAVRAGSTDESDMQVLREAFAETGASHRSTATPSSAKHLKDADTEEGELTVAAAQPVSEAPPAIEEIYLNSDTEIPEDIKEFAKELGSAREIYRFVKEKINYEAYAGSKKGASVTLDQLGGNDIDQARLLIALLRSVGVPARYVTGTVEITAEQAVAVTGAADAGSAGRILEARHKGVKGVTKQGVLNGYRMEQTWVEAYVPYTDYRGAGNAEGKSVWVPLDPSFKTLSVLTDTVTFDLTADEQALISAMDAMAEDQPVIYSEYVHPDHQAEISVRTIDAVDDSYLPASLPYTVLSVKERYAALPDERKDSLSIAVNGEELFSGLLTDIYLQRITVSYVPATDSDRKLLDSDAKLTEVPAYLVQMLPVVKVRSENGTQTYTGKQPVALGGMQQMTTTLKNEGDTTILTDDIFAGSVYAFNFDYQRIMPADISYSYGLMMTARDAVNESNYASPEIIGAMLDYAGKNYFALCDETAAKYETALNICRSRQFSLCITGYQFNSKDTLGIVDKLENASFMIDVAYNHYAAVSYAGSVQDETAFNTAIGFIESYHEGIIWECLTNNGLRGISTVSLINAALRQNIPIRLVCVENEEEALAASHVSESVKEEVRDFVNKGMLVELVADTVSIGDWTGTAYIARDVQTGAASFMLSGGTAGGASECFELMFLINSILLIDTLFVAGIELLSVSFKLALSLPSAKLSAAKKGMSTAWVLAQAFDMHLKNCAFIFDYAAEGDAMLERYYEFTMANLKRTESYLISCIHGAVGEAVGGIMGIFQDSYEIMEYVKDAYMALNKAGSTAVKIGKTHHDLHEKKKNGMDYDEWLEECAQAHSKQAIDLMLDLVYALIGDTMKTD